MNTSEHPAFRMPQPKGYRCPACAHLTFVHREHGCDSEGCDCTAPHGRIMPADSAPTSDADTVLVVLSAARERLARHLYADNALIYFEALKRWDAGEVPAHRMDDFYRAADRALAAIAGKDS